MKKIIKMPKFNNIKEEAAFWDTHSIADYWGNMEAIQVSYELLVEKKDLMTLRVAPSLKKKVESIAKEYDLTPSSLIRAWIVDKVRDLDDKKSYKV